LSSKEATTTGKYENAAQTQEERYDLRLYVTNLSPKSARALTNIKAILEENLYGRYDLEVVDVEEHPEAVYKDNIFAIPTLIKIHPLPLRKLVGDMSNKEKVLSGLQI
jgi:circadian clock protein KaiB